MKIRSPICTLVGHVDHGKSSILDYISSTNITSHEAGGITQKISSVTLSISRIKKITGQLINKLNIEITIPGILFIDTPGHAAFTSLRKRGGNLADIAILVIDIKEGIRPQTLESIEILRSYRTPFIIALNKIDNLQGWRSDNEIPLIENIKKQSEITIKEIETRLYNLVGKLSELNLKSERFDRVEDYTKQIAIIPCSAKTGEGIPELLMVVTGLAQKYLENSLKIEVSGQAKGTILEVKEEKGMGKIIDVIIYDGALKQGDRIAIATLDEPIETKIRAIFVLEKGILKPKKEVTAAADLIISAPGLDKAISGMTLQTITNNKEQVEKELKEEIKEVLIETDKEGVIIKADTLGSLEALIKLLKERNVLIKKAEIGEINKKDIAGAKTEKDKSYKVILGFNIKNSDSKEVKIITHDVIYRIIEDYESWLISLKEEEEKRELSSVVFPAKVQILVGTVFRQSNPAIVGVRVLGGRLRSNSPLMKVDGSSIGEIKSIQSEGENVQEAKKNQEVAISLPKITVGRQIDEDMILYSDLPEDDFIKLKKLKRFLNSEEIEVLKEIVLIKRRTNQLWGI